MERMIARIISARTISIRVKADFFFVKRQGERKKEYLFIEVHKSEFNEALDESGHGFTRKRIGMCSLTDL